MLGFIGTGNMATAIIRGVLSSGLHCADEIAVYDVNGEKAAAFADENGAVAFDSAADLIAACDTLVLAVKPNVLETVLTQNATALQMKNPLIISIAAGKTLAFLGAYLPFPARLVRVMPNINAVVGAAVSAFCGNENASADDLAFVEKFCQSFGTALALPETQFPIFGVLGGCSPAFAYLFIDAMAQAGVKHGLPKQMALEISAQAILGSAKMILESEAHPRKLIDNVCSPGGTTIEGVLALQKDGFETAVHDAVQAAYEKDQRL